jgi:hypothetical protein
MFHELFLSFDELLRRARPWQSSFWLTPAHQAVVGGLVEAADICLTNCDLYASLLGRWRRARPLPPVVPAFSNVGEPARCPNFRARPPLAVVFGLAARRQAVYRRLGVFAPFLRAAGIRAVIDIGPPIESLPVTLEGIDLCALGVLPPEEISTQLGQARLGLLHYPVSKLAKSGVLAAFAAHGVAPVISNQDAGGRRNSDLRGDEHYIALDRWLANPGPVQSLADISGNLRTWYDRHGLRQAFRTFHSALQLPEEQARHA